MTFQADPFIGETFLGRYRIVDRVAKGGMGVVYLGRGEGAGGFRRPVVVKIIAPEHGDDADISGMFMREAKVLAELRHPNIVSIVDYGYERGVHVMVLEYVRGFPLNAWYRFLRKTGASTPVEHALHILGQVLEALVYVHGLRKDGRPTPVIHRDISPSNILLETSGHVKLVDFGIAKSFDGDDAGYQTTDDRSVKGKFAYMAPELFQSSPASPGTDLYACGVVLREMLVGHNAFRGRDVSETLRRVMHHEPEPLGELRSDVSPELDAFVLRAIHRDPAVRFGSAPAMLEALRGLRTEAAEDVRASLAARLEHDFEGPLPELMGVTSLEERDQLWRTGEFAASTAAEDPVALAPALESVREAARPEPRPQRGFGLAFALAVLLLAIVVGGGAALFLSRQPAAAPVITVSAPRGSPGDPGAPPGGAAAEPPSGAEELGPLEATMTDRPTLPDEAAPSRTGSGAVQPAAIQQALARQQQTLRRCFERHALEGVTQVTLRARIATSGAIDHAEILESEVSRSALGGCLVEAAHRLRFDPRRTATTFRIPLRAPG